MSPRLLFVQSSWRDGRACVTDVDRMDAERAAVRAGLQPAVPAPSS